MTPEQIDEGATQSFFILGAAKCATTSLYEYMVQHPDFCLSEPKEPVFFEAEFEQGLHFDRRKYYNRALEDLLGRALPSWFERDARRTATRG